MADKNTGEERPVYKRPGAAQPPPQKGKKGDEGKRKRNWIIRIGLMIVLIILIILLLLRACNRTPAPEGFQFDANAQSGFLPGMTPDEVQAELNRIVEEGMFNISIASTVYFENGEAQGAVRIENIPANRYHMQVTLTRDDTGEVLYTSQGIQPGQYIEFVQLDENLPAGTYEATALFTAYNQETFAEEGQAAAKVTIVVQN